MASRPISTPASPGKQGRFYFANDTNIMWYDYGTGWAQLTSTVKASAGTIPGEIRAWSGSAVPDQPTYGHWVFADGTVYPVATYPLAAANIASQWRTAHGAADPGASNFRVPDLRGMNLMGLDQMPGGVRANRVTRPSAIIIATRFGEEYHILATAEMPSHAHTVSDPGHNHGVNDPGHAHGFPGQTVVQQAAGAPGGYENGFVMSGAAGTYGAGTGIYLGASGTGVSVASAGGSNQHENMPPTVAIPYIVKMDD
jgi:microcystin-dependent protein